MSAGDWVYERDSVPKINTEFWFHTTSQIWFKVKRNTGTNQIYSAEVLRE
jgi:sarcosine oxidase delta subunit